MLYREEAPDVRRTVKLEVQRKLPRRVLVLGDADREALGLVVGPSDILPAEVPKQPADRRVMLEYEGMPAPGADAFRWFFYASNPPWNNTRHSLSNVRGLQKELPIKLRNVYSFFVIYANIDGFDPIRYVGREVQAPGGTSDRSSTAGSSRKWRKRRLRSSSEWTRSSPTRRPRCCRRWWTACRTGTCGAPGSASGRRVGSRTSSTPTGTLYQCLRDLSLMIAPFLPFGSGGHVPEPRGAALRRRAPGQRAPAALPRRRRLPASTRRCRTRWRRSESWSPSACRCAPGGRSRPGSRWAEARIVLARPETEEAVRPYLSIMEEELNVVTASVIERADELVSYRVKPNFQALGRRLGPRMKAAQRAIQSADAGALLRALDDKGEVVLSVDGEDLTFTRDDLVVAVGGPGGLRGREWSGGGGHPGHAAYRRAGGRRPVPRGALQGSEPAKGDEARLRGADSASG